MSDLNQLFTGFSTLFDSRTSPEDKARVKNEIQKRIENNLDLITRLAKENIASTTNIIHLNINH
jgi:two-component sensor histidine kinase